MQSPRITVIIVAYRSRAFMPECLAALAQQSVSDFEVIVVQNGREDDSMQGIALPDGRYRVEVLDTNVGFAVANNHAARQAKGEWLALLNPDAIPSPDWLAELLAATQRWPDAASFGSTQLCLENPKLLDGVGDVWHAAGIAWRARMGQPATNLPPEGEIFGPCAAAALYRRDAFLGIGGFDESYFCYCEDLDLAYRLRIDGHTSVQVPSAVVRHAGSAISGRHSEFTLFHGHRNRIWTFVKNTPGMWVFLLLPWHVAYNAAIFFSSWRRDQGGPVWRGYKAAIADLPRVWRARRAVQRRRKASNAAILNALMWSLPFKDSHRDINHRLLSLRAKPGPVGRVAVS